MMEQEIFDRLVTIKILVQKAADGSDYVQISSPAAMPVNIVLVADRVEVEDAR